MGTRKNALITLLAAVSLLGCASDEPADGANGDDGNGGDDGMMMPPDDFMPAPEDLVDDLEDNNDAILEQEGRGGSWYLFNDGTAGAEQKPTGETFQPREGGANGSKFAASTAGMGFKTWGAGMGFDFAYDGVMMPKGVYDASMHTGITFLFKSNTKVRVALVMPDVVPTEEGGTCVPGEAETEACSDTHGVDVAGTNNEWKRVMLPFTMFKQGMWGKTVAFDAKKLMAMHFIVPQNVTFDFAVDDIAFY